MQIRGCLCSVRSATSARSTCPASPCCGTTRLFSIDRNFEPGPTLAAIENEKLNVAWFAPVMVGMPDEC
jgi:hypothetical protein